MWAAWLAWARGWVAGLVVAVLLAGLTEMVLPQGETRRYVRLVTGLVVLMAVALPLLSLVRLGVGPSLRAAAGAAATGTGAQGTLPGLTGAAAPASAASSLAESNRRATLDLVQWGLERQVEGLALGTAGVAAARGRVALLDGQPPRVKWVFLQVWPAAGEAGQQAVQPAGGQAGQQAMRPVGWIVVELPASAGRTQAPATAAGAQGPGATQAVALAGRLKDAVARELGVDPGLVRIQVEPPGTAPAAGSAARTGG